MDKQLQPKLVFTSSEWKYNRLSYFIKNLVSGVSVNSENKEIINDEIGILKTSSVVNGKFIPSENKRILPQDIERARLNPRKNTLLISRMNTPDLVGNFGFIENDYPNLFIPDRLWMTELNDNIVPKFLNYCLLTPKSKFKITSLATGTSNSMKNISKTSFLDIEVATPSLSEQQKIADYLSTIDEKLSLLEEKKTELSRYKKAMMQKLFSQEIRFKDENGNDFSDWEEKRLGKISEINKGQQLNKENFIEDGSYKVLNGGISHSGFTNSFNRSANVITISEGGNSCGYINYIKEDFWIGGHCYSLDNITKNNYDKFLFQYLKFSESKVMRLRVGSGLPNIQKGDLSKFIILIPHLSEQQKIADFLSAIDESIAKVSEQINETQNFKKAMLQQMFV